jgi:hypothetical protein
MKGLQQDFSLTSSEISLIYLWSYFLALPGSSSYSFEVTVIQSQIMFVEECCGSEKSLEESHSQEIFIICILLRI